MAGRRQDAVPGLGAGAFTPHGTYDALAAELPRLRALGIGVTLFAPTSAYGRPDALRRLGDRAHALELGVPGQCTLLLRREALPT